MTVRAEISERSDIVLLAEFRDKDLCKSIPGARWDPNDKVWRVPLSWASCKALRGVFGDRLEIGDRLVKWAWELKIEFIDPALTRRLVLDDEEMAAYEPRLFDFQRGGVAFLTLLKEARAVTGEAAGALLSDEMGSGKTVQVIVALRWLHEHDDGSLPLLVICPKAMKRTWERELNTWWPGLRIGVITGGAVERKKVFTAARARDLDVVIMHWEVARLHSRLAPYGSIRLTDKEKETKELNLVQWKGVVIDEAHKMKNPQAQQTRAVWGTVRGPSIKYRFALTGTPVANAPHDMWAVLHALSPTEFPSKTRYVDRYCLLSWNAFGGLDVIGLRPDTADEFFSVVDPRMRRMPKALVLSHLPPILREKRIVEMDAKQAKAYRDMAEQMFTRLENGDTIITTNPIAQLTRLVQFSSSYAEVDADSGDVRLVAPSNKVDALLEIIDEVGKESIVVFAQSRQLIMLASEALTKHNVSHSLIVGGQTDLERQAAIDDFQGGRVQVILCTVAAGGVGVTLTRARICVFLQRDFSLVNNVQAEARIHRIGSEIHESVVIIDVVSENTVDEHIIDVIVTKQERLEEVVRDRATLAQLLTTGAKKKGKKK